MDFSYSMHLLAPSILSLVQRAFKGWYVQAALAQERHDLIEDGVKVLIHSFSLFYPPPPPLLTHPTSPPDAA